MLPIDFLPIKIEQYYTPISIILAAIAIIVIKELPRYKIINNRQYSYDYRLFVDRKSQIEEILKISRRGKSIINIFGISGIGVSEILKFTADIINKKTPINIRIKYYNHITSAILFRKIAWYFNVSKIVDCESLVQLLCNDTLISSKHNTNVLTFAEMMSLINKKIKKKGVVIILDEIYNDEQMRIVEAFIMRYFQFRPQDTFIIGSHEKTLSYHLTYRHLEILKFTLDDLMVLAKAHSVELKENEGVQLFELSDGIPLFAYLLLRYYDKENGLCEDDLIEYLNRELIPHLSTREKQLLYELSILNLSVDLLTIDFIQKFDSKIKESDMLTLDSKGLLRYQSKSKEVLMSKFQTKQYMCLIKNTTNISYALYKFYKQNSVHHFALMYLLLSDFDEEDEPYFVENIELYLNNKDILTLSIILTPSINMSIDIKHTHPKIYLKYVYVCISMLSSCGNYLKAKEFINQLVVDGTLIKRFDSDLNDEEFEFYFQWADVLHLLNDYDEAIDIIEHLTTQAENRNETKRLPKLYWMKAHCLRHQWKTPDESLNYYRMSEEISHTLGISEYIIRSLHGKICISLIRNDMTFDFISAFRELDEIYETEPEKWRQYLYTTYKYKSIYQRLNGNKAQALEYLKKSLDGFISIGKRNIYDVYFEYGEFYRYYKDFANSIEHYRICLDFSSKNMDYNLQSLSELGIVLCELKDGKENDETIHDKLLNIQKKSKDKQLHLNNQYAKFIENNMNSLKESDHILLFNP